MHLLANTIEFTPRANTMVIKIIVPESVFKSSSTGKINFILMYGEHKIT